MKKIPFGYIEDDAFHVFSHDGKTNLGSDWLGVCNGAKTTEFWYLGRDPVSDVRTHMRLRSRNYEEALQEAGVFEQQQRLRDGTATFNSFKQAVSDLFNGDPAPVMGKTGKFSVCLSNELIEATKSAPALDAAAVQQLGAMRAGLEEITQRAETSDVELEEWAEFQDKQHAAMESFAESFVHSKTFCGMSAESATQRWVLSPSSNTPGAWQVSVFSPKDMPWGHSVHGDVRKGIYRLLEDSDFQNVQVYHAPMKVSDAACTVQDTLYFIVDKIPEGKEVPVLMRELCKRHSGLALSGDEMQSLVSLLKSWEHSKRSSPESQIFYEATRRASLFYGPEHDQHLFAYAVEEAISMGVEPNTMAPQGSVDEWLGKIDAVAERFYKSLSGKGQALSPQELVDFAYAMAQLDSPEVGVDVRRILREARESNQAEAGMKDKHPLGFYVMQDDKNGFCAQVRDARGAIVAEVNGGDRLGTNEASLVDFGFMSNYYDLDGLQNYLVDIELVSANSIVVLGEDMDRLMAPRQQERPVADICGVGMGWAGM